MISLHFTIPLILALAITLSQQVSTKPETDLSDSLTNILQKLDEIKESNAENAAAFQKELSKQSDAIQQIKSKQETMQATSIKLSSLLESNKGCSLQQVCQQIANLTDTIQQVQQKQSKVEQALNKNVYSLRLILDSFKLNLGEMLISAVKNGDDKQVLFLLELGAPVEYQNSEKNRPVHVAVEHLHHRILEILIENKADIETKGRYQQTPLTRAGYSNCVECARILLDKGADIASRDQWQNTPIIHPARAGHKAFVELLLQRGANINESQVSGVTGLHWAAQDGKLPIVKFLIEKGADIRQKTVDGKTPLDVAMDHQRNLIVDYLQNLMKNN